MPTEQRQSDQCADLERRWAERDAKREAFEAEMRGQAKRHRDDHVKIVRDALWQAFARYPQGNPNHWAEVAVDALLDDGVVFARMGPCDLNDGEARTYPYPEHEPVAPYVPDQSDGTEGA